MMAIKHMIDTCQKAEIPCSYVQYATSPNIALSKELNYDFRKQSNRFMEQIYTARLFYCGPVIFWENIVYSHVFWFAGGYRYVSGM